MVVVKNCVNYGNSVKQAQTAEKGCRSVEFSNRNGILFIIVLFYILTQSIAPDHPVCPAMQLLSHSVSL